MKIKRNIIDYTKRKKDKEGFVECPKCGKVGKKIEYQDGSIIVKHKIRINKSNLFCYSELKEYCWVITPKEAKNLKSGKKFYANSNNETT
jgi:uncharacterized C2H2 Zn-finger protein